MATSQRNWGPKTFPLCNKGKQLRHWTLGLVNFVVMVGAIATSGTYAVAQIKPDGTLGAESSVVTPQVPGSSIDVISGGATRGANLFHSFEQFSVVTGREAFFNNAESIQNIISRVTGSSISNIDGLLRANARASLFLLNPNGIIFGPNARLDVGGSFVGSTADSLNFADGTQFSAKAPQNTPLLTVSVPIGLQYGGNAGRIANQSVASDSSGTPVGLQVQTGNTLTLAGKDVSLDGGRLTAPGGRVELGGVAQAGTIGLNGDGSLSYPEGVPRADVSLTNGSRVDVTAGSGGSIALNARNLDILAGSRLNGGISSGLQSIDTQAGDITLNATGKITIANSVISNSVAPGAVGNTGNINVKAESLSLADGAFLGSLTFGQGNAGNISLQVNGDVSLTGRGESTLITSSVFSGAVGNSGNINIKAGSLSLTDGVLVGSLTSGQGNAGSVSVQSDGVVSIAGDVTSIFSLVNSGAVGNSDNINIKAGSLSLTDGAALTTQSSGQGNSGSVFVQATDAVSLRNGAIASNIESVAPGYRGGDINIQSRSLSLTDRSTISTDTFKQGDSGNISLQATDAVFLENSLISSGVFLGAVGNGGNINIKAGEISTDRSFLSSIIFGQGNAGKIILQATDAVSLSNSVVFTPVFLTVGNGADINIQTRELSLSNGTQLATSTFGQGNAGNIQINATESVSVSGGSLLQTSTVGQGNAGDINIQAGGKVSFDGVGNANSILSSLFTGLLGQGNLGNFTIPFGGTTFSFDNLGLGNLENVTIQGGSNTISLNGEGLPSGAFSSVGSLPGIFVGNGKSGNINITAGSLFLTNGAELSASTAGQGDAGNIFVRTLDSVELSGFSPNGVSSGLFTGTDSTASGKGGEIEVNTGILRLSNGAVLSARTRNNFRGGDITVNVDTLEATGGGELLTTAYSTGSAGDINVNATDKIAISGSDPTFDDRLTRFGRPTVDPASSASGLFANTAPGSRGNGGNVIINPTNQVTLNDNAQIAVDSAGVGNAGEILLQADSLTLDNRALISATTATGQGGNINLQLPNILLLRRNSNISTTAGASGNGGNITINNPFLIALPGENSDITANAFSGSGGRVNINAQGVFGLEPRSRQELQTLVGTDNPSELDPNRLPSNDITAISQSNPNLSGFVTFNTPDVDPSRGLVELPGELVEASNQIASSCVAGGENKFNVVGRGGLPPNPRQPLSGEAVLTNWATLEGAGSREQGAGSRGALKRNSFFSPSPHLPLSPIPHSPSSTIVEATGWVINDKGEVVLTATAPTTTVDIPWITPTQCHGS